MWVKSSTWYRVDSVKRIISIKEFGCFLNIGICFPVTACIFWYSWSDFSCYTTRHEAFRCPLCVSLNVIKSIDLNLIMRLNYLYYNSKLIIWFQFWHQLKSDKNPCKFFSAESLSKIKHLVSYFRVFWCICII